MKTLQDFEGRAIRLTDERLRHILEHSEMAEMESAIAEALRSPELVIQSRTDDTAALHYRLSFLRNELGVE